LGKFGGGGKFRYVTYIREINALTEISLVLGKGKNVAKARGRTQRSETKAQGSIKVGGGKWKRAWHDFFTDKKKKKQGEP